MSTRALNDLMIRSVLLGLGCLTFGISPTVASADLGQSTDFQIPPQQLPAALLKFAAQSGVQVTSAGQLLEGKSTVGVVGTFEAREALERLLQGTQLSFQVVDDNTVLIVSGMESNGKGATLGRVTDSEAQGDWGRGVRLAQTEDSPAGSGTSSAQQSGAAGSNGQPSQASETLEQLEEITVTAQKRVERLQDVPISITVLSGRDLDKFTGEGVRDALTLVPGIKVTQGYQDGGTLLSLRGVSASGPLFNGSSPVAYYIDSVPFGLVKTAIAPDSNAYDLERIEVLRGPQGTLYGASALNGVVRVLTHDADLDEFELKTRASLSTTEKGAESYRGDLAVNVPLIEGKLAARAVVGYDKAGGWIDKLTESDANEADLRNMRLKINAKPTDNLSVGMFAWLSRADYGAPPVSGDDYQFPGAGDQPIFSDYDVFGLNVGYEFSAFALSSMTSHIDYSNDGTADFSMFALDFNQPVSPTNNLGTPTTDLDSEVFSQEITLRSTTPGPWKWTAGGFYRDAKDRLFQEWPEIQPADIDFTDESESFAVFGELTRVFAGGKVELTGGLRYFEDRVAQIENSPWDGDTTRPLTHDTTTFDHVSPRLVLTLHPSDRATVYGSYSEGFRSGFNQNANIVAATPAGQFPPVKEDKLRNYEVGAKGSLLDGRIQYDTSVYYIDWQDVQQTLNVEISGACCFSGVVNGESASGIGVDLALTTRPIDGLELGAAFSWNDLALDADVESGGITLFNEGDRLNYSAKHTAGASIGYVFPVSGGGLEGRISASGNYSSEQAFRIDAAGFVFLRTGDDILTARTNFSLGAPDRWTATLFVDNVTNEDGAPVRAITDFFSSRVRPRTVGLQFEYRFGQ